MKYVQTLVGVSLVFLLGATPALGQTATAPVWIQQAWANHDGFSVRPHAIDQDQNRVYVSGRADLYLGGATFGNLELHSDSSYAFLVSYEENGTQRWVRAGAFGDTSTPFVDSYGGFQVAVQGERVYTSEGLIFNYDSGQLTAGGLSVNRYDSDGTAMRTVVLGKPDQFPGEWSGFVVGFGVDQTSNVYTAGIYRDTLILAPDTLVAFPMEAPNFVGDVFLASYTPEGDLRWSQRIGGPRTDVIAAWLDPKGAFTVDAIGNTYLGGFFGSGAVFGEGQSGEVTLHSDGYALASFDAEGALRWVRTGSDLGISDNAGPDRLAVDEAGNLIVDWFIRSIGGPVSATVGDTTFYDPGFGGEFLTKLSPDGEILWARQLRSDGNEFVNEITTDTEGHVYVAGHFDGRFLQLEDKELTKNLETDENDGFVAHYDSEGLLRWVAQAAGTGTQRINALTTDLQDNLYIAGEFEEMLHLGSVTLEAQVIAGFDMFVAKYDAATITAIEPGVALPPSVVLRQNYPNPFNPTTTISYTLPRSVKVELKIYDVLGRDIATLVDSLQPAGEHTTSFEARHLPSGIYFYQFTAGDFVQTKSMILMK